ncbi:MAG TPA: flagellar export protein FliJ [Geobacteraceae bacterium]|nr:flagellar export protein FliJ [Geobacteraceae bacterium]
MRRNVFNLERVLHFRRETEKLRKMELALAKREHELAEDRLRREEEAIEKLNLEFMNRQIEGISAFEMQLYSDFFRKKKVDILQQRDQVTELDRQVVEKKDHLVEAATEKKIMEQLKQKRIQAHEKEIAVKEQAFLDEIALQRRGSQA